MLTITNTLNKDITSLVMYDVTGKLVMDKGNIGKANSYEFSTASLSDGVYIVTAKTRDNLEMSKKVIVSRK
ncbi:MAG: T9SS type A sorting domain-containing protein [Flavobacterium sp.]|nr:T9SS type A sorting domain-containing protein [Flavobacterium sp.]